MPTRLVAMSHTPLLGKVPVTEDTSRELEEQFSSLRKQVRDFDPTLVVLFAPDHYNGFFHDVMPAYCVGMSATAIGDFDSAKGDLLVASELAEDLVRHLHSTGHDATFSRAMQIDHGAVQPLEILFGGLEEVRVIPVFVNGVAPPFVPMSQIRRLGAEIGRFAGELDERVLLIASGGLSHDPPVPQWDTATSAVRPFLVDGRGVSAQARAEREARVMATAVAFSQGTAQIQDLNPEWDLAFMRRCREGALDEIDAYDPDEMSSTAGHSSHEVRTWLAAFAALSTASPGSTVTTDYYRPIREYIAGFGLMSAG